MTKQSLVENWSLFFGTETSKGDGTGSQRHIDPPPLITSSCPLSDVPPYPHLVPHFVVPPVPLSPPSSGSFDGFPDPSPSVETVSDGTTTPVSRPDLDRDEKPSRHEIGPPLVVVGGGHKVKDLDRSPSGGPPSGQDHSRYSELSSSDPT